MRDIFKNCFVLVIVVFVALFLFFCAEYLMHAFLSVTNAGCDFYVVAVYFFPTNFEFPIDLSRRNQDLLF